MTRRKLTLEEDARNSCKRRVRTTWENSVPSPHARFSLLRLVHNDESGNNGTRQESNEPSVRGNYEMDVEEPDMPRLATTNGDFFPVANGSAVWFHCKSPPCRSTSRLWSLKYWNFAPYVAHFPRGVVAEGLFGPQWVLWARVESWKSANFRRPEPSDLSQVQYEVYMMLRRSDGGRRNLFNDSDGATSTDDSEDESCGVRRDVVHRSSARDSGR